MKIPLSEHPEICKRYCDGASATEVAKIYHVSQNTITAILLKNKVNYRGRRSFPCDESFFAKIDDEAKAYFLGLIYADANIDSKGYNIDLSLQYNDKDILEKLSSLILYGKPLAFRKAVNHHKTGNLQSPMSRLVICSKKVVNDLAILGATSKKSHTLTFPDNRQVPHALIHHFVRGYFDGDGCCSVGCRKPEGSRKACYYTTASMISTRKFNKGIEELLPLINWSKHNYKKNIQSIATSDRNSIHRFYQYIYQDATIFLQRKKEKFEEGFSKMRYSPSAPTLI